MAKLYFRYGAMGSSKTANAIMVQYNYQERGQNALMIKPQLDVRDGARTVGSRSGLSAQCVYMEELSSLDLTLYDCLIVDEAQFLKKEQVEQLVRIVDEMNIPVICYGLRADFRGQLFEGSTWLMAWADTIEEIKTVCWCGRKATCNARVVNGKVAREGEQIVLGGSESYVALCRKHWASGELAAFEVRKITTGKHKYLPLLLDAGKSEEKIEQYLQQNEMYMLSCSGEAVSLAIVGAAKDGMCDLYELSTIQGERHKGYATRLLQQVERLCKPTAHTLRVKTNSKLRGFYERLGYQCAAGEDEFAEMQIMEKRL